MITAEEDGSYSVRSGDINTFLGIVEEQCKVYDENLNKKLTDIGHDTEQVIRTNNNQVFPPYISTLFSALYLEAFIYDYCARKESSSLAKTLDKLDPPSKWVVATRLINGQGIDTSKNAYQNLKKLFQLRNQLAHSKTKKIDFENNYDDESTRERNFFEPEKCISIIQAVLEELLSIDKDDIYTQIIVHRLKGNIVWE